MALTSQYRSVAAATLVLAAGLGSSVTIDADGPDADQALAALRTLIADKFGEGE